LKDHRLSLERIETAARTIDPVFLNTPQFESESLSDELGIRLVLKVEVVNPIRSFKGRGTDFLVSNLPASSPTLVCASAGNFGQGLAYAARKRALPVVIFAAESANALKLDRMRKLGADVRLAGRDFDAAKEHAHNFAEKTGACYIEDGREPAIAEGAGSIAVELCRWKDPFDVLLFPLGNGALLAGVGRWMKAHSPATRVVAVCAAGAPAMALSLQERTVHCTETADTIADGIAVRVPVPEALDDLADVVDDVVLVDDDAMVEAMKLVFQFHGLVLEPAGAAGVAAAMVFRDRFRGSRVAALLSGGNRTL
jgi:threonine dehydratase